MEILKSYRYRLEPTEEQKELLNKHFGSTRFVYNHFLNEKNNQYKETKKSDNYKKQAEKLTYLKNEEGTLWLNEVNSQCLQQSLKNLETAFKNFFKKKAKYPKFKTKKSKNSFRVPQHIKVIDERIFVPKFKEGIKLIEHRPFKGTIKQCTFSKDCSLCGWIKEDLELNDREWFCKSCGCFHDRDLNAAKNILNQGLKIISVGTTEYTDGEVVCLYDRLLSMKSEAPMALA